MTYSSNHWMATDNGCANVHVTVRLQEVDVETAHRFVQEVLDVAETFSASLSLPETPEDSTKGAAQETKTTILRPQTSGPCVHCYRYGEKWVDRIDEMPTMELVVKVSDISDHFPGLGLPGYRGANLMSRQVLIDYLNRFAGTDAVAQCKYPHDDGDCPHLDNPEILCPIRDSCVAMGDALCTPADENEDEDEEEQPEPQPAPEQEDGQEDHDTDRRWRWREWTDAEIRAVLGADSPSGAIQRYRAELPDSNRTDDAIRSYWYKARSGGRLLASREPKDKPKDKPRPTPPSPSSWARMRVRILGPSDLAGRTGVVMSSSDPREMLIALEDSSEHVWLPRESLLLIGVGKREGQA